MELHSNTIPKAIVIHAGARDDYQLAQALYEKDFLHKLVTNIYWKNWADKKFQFSLEPSKVSIDLKSLMSFIIMRSTKSIDLNHSTGSSLGKHARRIAVKTGNPIFSCSYTAYEAFKPGPDQPEHRLIFQLHPHPITAREILLEELERTPSAKFSLMNEAELKLTSLQFEELVAEPDLANGWVVPSTFTAESLAHHGIDLNKISIIPHGLNFKRYPVRGVGKTPSGQFTIMFLGSLVQRKGLSYLLEAVDLLKTRNVRIILRGRGKPDQGIISQFRHLNIDLQLNLPTEQIVQDFHNSHLFVFPSLLESFAHVILQSMGCGLPVIATPHTCAPDIITDGWDGFIVPIRNPQAIAEKIEWAITHPAELSQMGQMAAQTAQMYSQEKFRAGIQKAYIDHFDNLSL